MTVQDLIDQLSDFQRDSLLLIDYHLDLDFNHGFLSSGESTLNIIPIGKRIFEKD